MPEWVFEGDFLVGLGVFSAVAFVGSLLLVPLLVARMPEDYFCNADQHTFIHGLHPAVRVVVAVLKNVVGVVLLFAGFLMLFLPGQGLLTMVLGVALMDFPGKFELEQRLIQKPTIHKPLNWIRKKTGKGAFSLPDM